MPCVYKYNINIPPQIEYTKKTLSVDGKVENFTYERERELIGRPNYVIVIEGNAIRKIDSTENFNTMEKLTVVKRGSSGKGKIVDTVLHIINISSITNSAGASFDGTYKSCPDKATINFNNTTGLRTLTFN